MKLFLIIYSLMVCSFAKAYVTHDQCQRGFIHNRLTTELERHLNTWPKPAIKYVEFSYAARLPGFPNEGDYRKTMCCVEAIAEPEANYPDCGVRRTICFDAGTFKLTHDNAIRSVNCDTGYP